MPLQKLLSVAALSRKWQARGTRTPTRRGSGQLAAASIDSFTLPASVLPVRPSGTVRAQPISRCRVCLAEQKRDSLFAGGHFSTPLTNSAPQFIFSPDVVGDGLTTF
ncbi:hypothetical protein VTI74DRAFT_3512 [Chaetomium olivicolor]